MNIVKNIFFSDKKTFQKKYFQYWNQLYYQLYSQLYYQFYYFHLYEWNMYLKIQKIFNNLLLLKSNLGKNIKTTRVSKEKYDFYHIKKFNILTIIYRTSK